MRTLLPVMLLLLLLAPPVQAHEHPHGSTDRVTPGAVRVEVGAKVDVTLLDDRAALKRFKRSYEVTLGAGSGFTVTPDGVIVTATGTVDSEEDPAVYAANRVFAEYYEQKIPADFARHTAGTGDLDFRLQSCYPPERSDSTCTAVVTPTVRVFPFLDPPSDEGYPAEILKTGADPSAPAVLRVTGGTKDVDLPTLPLAKAYGGEIKALDIMTYKGRPSIEVTPTVEVAHLDPPGSRTLLKDDRERIARQITADGTGGAVIDDAHSEVIGLVSLTGAETRFATVEDILAALESADVSAHRGPLDVVFETALAHYHDRSYSLAIPVLEQVLKLRPDHAVALSHLRDSRAWKGTDKEAKRPDADGGGPAFFTPWTIGAAVLLLAALGLGVLLLRKPRGPSPDEAVTAFVGSVPLPAAPLTTVDRSDPGQVPPRRPGPPSTPSTPSTPSGGAHPGPREPGPADRPAYCTRCGMRRGPAHRFCGYCGHPA
ncbi:hypothetical protein EDD29_6589 [Actinocorallia herbida]|uniref:Trypsin-like peptidase n=1 Tax=Actinocorallia herbida TaxID=58109 RepID=A0A3N1D5U8_9ACTN|nr:zinc ribbon domain-containing protein [Actinocorallia herbida]ROO88904.1 hypothetical protein EDD29_6589 [Actinocorallia herbida]